MQEVELQNELEKLWTDETPDHLDPDVKRYWRWSWSLAILIFTALCVGPIAVPFIFIEMTWFPGIMLLPFLTFYVIFCFPFLLWYSGAYYRSYTFLLTDQEIIITRGVFWKHRVVIPYNRVQNVNITSGPLERIFGLHRVHIHTAGVGLAVAEGHIPGIPFPDELAAIIMKRVRAFRYGDGTSDDEMGKDIEMFLAKFREYVEGK